MKLALFGASGMIGSRLLREAVRRGHAVTAVVRDPRKFPAPAGRVIVIRGDVLDAASVAAAVAGHDAVLSAVGPTPEVIAGAPRALIEGLTRAGLKRLIVVGGAGSLEVAPGVQLVDTPEFPADYKAVALAHRDALNLFRQNTTLDWTFVSPPAFIEPGERTGQFRLGGDRLIADAKGRSHISAEDYAIAFIDEVEKPRHIRLRFTVGY
jgi:putative NADH-flavin reductase